MIIKFGVRDLGGYKIGAVSLRVGLSRATLRLWEEQHGLLHPRRSAGGTRLYSEADVARILEITKLARRGHTLQAIAQVLDQARSDYPDLVLHLVELESSTRTSEVVRDVAGQARAFLEASHLRDATNRDLIREARLSKQIFGAISRAIATNGLDEASSVLVAAARELSGAPRSGFALYDPPSDSLTVRLVHTGHGVRQAGYPPWPVDRLRPAELSQALRRRQPFYAPNVDEDELQPGSGAGLVPTRIRSFSVYPLSVGTDLLGSLSLASPNVDGISGEAQQVIGKLALLAAPAIGYFLQKARTSGRN